jgi:predicted ATP-binding protein involved in virulence
MKIDYLILNDYKNLINFKIDFDETKEKQVILGQNGTGKTNLFEAIIKIFRSLDLKEDLRIECEIKYSCNNSKILITSRQINKEECNNNPSLIAKYENKFYIANLKENVTKSEKYFVRKNTFFKLNENDDTRLLPKYLFSYYSGISNRLAPLFHEHERKYYSDQISGTEKPFRRLFMTKSYHSQFALLSYYANPDKKTQEFLKNEFNIEGIDSVLFSFREPDWSKTKNKNTTSPLDYWFWGLDGMVKPFLRALFKFSIAPMKTEENISLGFGKKKKIERCHLFLNSQDSLLNVVKELNKLTQEASKEFFTRLESAIFSGALSENEFDVKVNIKLTNGKIISFLDLSEGERQILTVLGLLKFTNKDESLFLLDEPDTHLNPTWELNYLNHLDNYGFIPKNSQILISTHSPLFFSGLKKEEVIILSMNKETENISSFHPSSDPKGMSFSAILTSEFFGMRTLFDIDSFREFEQMRVLSFKEKRSAEEEKEYLYLKSKYNNIDFSTKLKDDSFNEFTRRMYETRLEKSHLWNAILTPEDIVERRKLAKKIFEEIKQKELK